MPWRAWWLLVRASLFREWDANGDGEVSRTEFHKAMPAIGLEVSKKAIDDLFTEWDRDRSGSIDYTELRRCLRVSPDKARGPSKFKAGAQAAVAVSSSGQGGGQGGG